MKTFAAMGTTNRYFLDALRSTAYPYVLVSFAFYKDARLIAKLGYPFQLMLDSGAHSVWTRGETIDLDRYIVWAQECVALAPDTRVTNLDVIPGSREHNYPSKREVLKAVAQSAENALAIREAGLRVIEVLHMRDPIATLDALVERRRPGELIGIGGLTALGSSPRMARAFGDSVFSRLHALCGDTLPPTHGYAVGDISVPARYPLSSGDSTTWAAPHRYGVAMSKRGVQRRPVNGRQSNNVAYVEMVKVLDFWKQREADLAALWRWRGVETLAEGALAER